jgi:hypothetical protein
LRFEPASENPQACNFRWFPVFFSSWDLNSPSWPLGGLINTHQPELGVRARTPMRIGVRAGTPIGCVGPGGNPADWCARLQAKDLHPKYMHMQS